MVRVQTQAQPVPWFCTHAVTGTSVTKVTADLEQFTKGEINMSQENTAVPLNHPS
jgi:hypothetical protein